MGTVARISRKVGHLLGKSSLGCEVRKFSTSFSQKSPTKMLPAPAFRMGTVVKISRKVGHLFGTSSLGCEVRKFSTFSQKSSTKLASDSDSCFILTYHGKMRYSADRLITLDEFFKDVPLFDKFLTDRLIEKVNPDMAWCTSDRIKKLLRTAIVPLYICKQLGMSIPGAFKDGNVGVLSGMDVFAFKELDIHDLATDVNSPHAMTENNSYDQFVHFFKYLVCKYVCPEALGQLPAGFERFLKDLEMADTDDDNLVYNPVFWPKILMATMFFEFHRLLQEEFPARGLSHKAMKILKAIYQNYPHFPEICAKSDFLISWAGVHSKRSGLSGMDISSTKANRYEESAEEKEFSAELLHALHSVAN